MFLIRSVHPPSSRQQRQVLQDKEGDAIHIILPHLTVLQAAKTAFSMANLQLSEQRNKQKNKNLHLHQQISQISQNSRSMQKKKGITASQIKHPQKDAYTQMSSIERKQKTGKLFWQSFFMIQQ